jgi:hypothetical protein
MEERSCWLFLLRSAQSKRAWKISFFYAFERPHALHPAIATKKITA